MESVRDMVLGSLVNTDLNNVFQRVWIGRLRAFRFGLTAHGLLGSARLVHRDEVDMALDAFRRVPLSYQFRALRWKFRVESSLSHMFRIDTVPYDFGPNG